MRKMIYWMLALFIYSAASMNAQVTIGSQEDPTDGSVLDLSKVSGHNLGLLLPKVALTSVTSWSPVLGNSVEGMMVYNTSTSTSNELSGKGVYVWSENKWSLISLNETSSPYLPGIPSTWLTIPATVTGSGTQADPYKNVCPATTVVLTTKSGYTFGTISGGTVSGTTATFTSSGSVMVTQGTQSNTVYVSIGTCISVTGISVASVDGSPYVAPLGNSLQLKASITPESATNKGVTWTITSGNATITANGLLTTNSNAASGTVIARATATDGSGKYGEVTLSIACGAKISATQWKAFMCHNLGADESVDPLAPMKTTAAYTDSRLNGSYYQWGKKTPVATVSTSPNIITGWSTTAASSISLLDASKTTNDPCPTGWRIPTKAQWDGLVANNTRTAPQGATWTTSASDYSSGYRFGSSLYLPASGWRLYTDGSLFYRGYSGHYWSTTTEGTYSNNFDFTNTDANTNYYYRTFGFPIRCIAE